MGWVSAFSAFGRFSVTLPTRPFRSRMTSSLTVAPVPLDGRRILLASVCGLHGTLHPA